MVLVFFSLVSLKAFNLVENIVFKNIRFLKILRLPETEVNLTGKLLIFCPVFSSVEGCFLNENDTLDGASVLRAPLKHHSCRMSLSVVNVYIE